MQYITRPADNPEQAHVNYACPCGCVAGVFYDKAGGSTHLGECCCGRLLWIGGDAESRVREGYAAGVEYVLDRSNATLPWGDEVEAVLAVPAGQLQPAQAPSPATVLDVVCGMKIDPATAAAASEHKGTTYYFCAVGCKRSFDANPGRYVKAKSLIGRILGR